MHTAVVALLNALVDWALRQRGCVRTGSYATSFCQQPHRLSDGKPVGHECMIVPPEALEAEAKGEYDRALRLLELAEPFTRSPGVSQ